MNEFFARWDSESPKFFKKLIKFGKWLAGINSAVLIAVQGIPDFSLPTWATGTLATIAAVGAVIAAVAGLAVADPTELQEKMNK